MKAQITRKKINLPKLFLVNWVRAGTSNSLQYLIWLKSKTVKIYSVVESVKLLLVLSILCNSFNSCTFSNLATQTHRLIKYLNLKVAIFGTTVPNLKCILFSPYAIGT